jgi:hypothetical protein
VNDQQEPLEGKADRIHLDAFMKCVSESGILGSGSRLYRLLSFLISEELEGRGEKIKAYTIATAVFSRPTSFDPQSDSIVRVEIGRLRNALELFYSSPFASSANIVVSIPKGSYRPVITIRKRQNEHRVFKIRHSAFLFSALASLLITFAVALSLIFSNTSAVRDNSRRNISERIAVALFEPNFSTESLPGLSVRQLQNFILSNVSSNALVDFFPMANDVSEDVYRSRFNFLVRTDIGISNNELYVITFVFDSKNSSMIYSFYEKEVIVNSDLVQASKNVLQKVGILLSRRWGVISGLAINRMPGESAGILFDSECYLRTIYYMRHFRYADFVSAKECFNRNFPDADGGSLAAYGFLLLYEARYGFRQTDWETALQSVREISDKSISLAPEDPYVIQLSYTVAICSGERERFHNIARGYVNQSKRLPGLLSDIGSNFVLGKNDATTGLEIIKEASHITTDLPVWQQFAAAKLFFDRGDYDTVLSLIDRGDGQSYPEAAVLRLIVHNIRGNRRGVASTIRALANAGVSQDWLPSLIERSCWTESHRTSLRQALSDFDRDRTGPL